MCSSLSECGKVVCGDGEPLYNRLNTGFYSLIGNYIHKFIHFKTLKFKTLHFVCDEKISHLYVFVHSTSKN